MDMCGMFNNIREQKHMSEQKQRMFKSESELESQNNIYPK